MNKILKILIIALGSIGVGIPIFSKGYNFFSLFYFTNQSNLLVVVVSAIFLYLETSGKEIKEGWHKLRFIATNAISLTFLVFNLILMPSVIHSGHSSYLYSANNLLLHNIVPLLMIVDYILYGKKYPLNKIYLVYIYPISYLVLALLYNPVFGISFPEPGGPTPYFFLNYKENGWFNVSGGFFKLGVVYWIIISLVIVFLISLCLHGLSKIRFKKSQDNQELVTEE